MGFFSAHFGRRQESSKGRFRSNDDYDKNRAGQMAGAPRVLGQLRQGGITDQDLRKLEYFFYTNSEEKATTLAGKLAQLGYAGKYDHSAGDKKNFVITGWTGPMRMDEPTILNWTRLMCDLGRNDDCEFDGWGTYITPE